VRFGLNLRRTPCLAVLAGLAFAAPAGPAGAQSKLEARYNASLAGIPVGRGSWVLDIDEGQYFAAASGRTTGLLRVITGGEGTSAARGGFHGEQAVPGTYASTISTDRRRDEVRLSFARGTAKEFVDPPLPPNEERIPLRDEHRSGVFDPMTASMVRVPGNGNLLSAEACNRQIPVFDGRVRFDLKLAFKRLETVKAEKGYAGPVLVCAVYFSPRAGHVPDRPAMRYLSHLQDMEVWLAPVSGTRVLVPFRLSVPTPLGLGLIEAEHFVSAARAKATSTSVRTH
jgi:hypothetical protein